MSESGRIDGEASLQDLTPQTLQEDYLVDVEVKVNGKKPTKRWWQKKIATALAHIEKEAQISIRNRRVLGEPHDYNAVDYVNFCFIQLWNRPLLSIQKVKAVYPTGTVLMDFPTEWIRPDLNASQVQIVPNAGSISQVLLGRGGAFLPLMFHTINYLPQFFHVDYTTGFPAGHLPEDIVDAVMKRAAIEVLAIAGDQVYGPGVTNISLSQDGFSESRGIMNNGKLGSVYTSRISQYKIDLYGEGDAYRGGTGQIGLVKRIKQYYGGVIVATL